MGPSFSHKGRRVIFNALTDVFIGAACVANELSELGKVTVQDDQT